MKNIKQWNGKWIWMRGTYHTTNFYLLVRKEYNIDFKPAQASIKVSADSRYTLYVNGERVNYGPARYAPINTCYDVLDITKHLRKGRNAICAVAHKTGEANVQIVNTYFSGIVIDGTIEGEGKRIVVATDASWKVKPSDSHLQHYARINTAQGFQEAYDFRKEDKGWLLPGYDDSPWQDASIISSVPIGLSVDSDGRSNRMADQSIPWINMKERDCPLLTYKPMMPERVIDCGIGNVTGHKDLHPGDAARFIWEQRKNCVSTRDYWIIDGDKPENIVLAPAGINKFSYIVFDFGRVLCGHVEVVVEDATAGEIIDIGYDERILYNIPRCGGNLEMHLGDRIFLKEGLNNWTSFGQRGFRYMILLFRNIKKPIRIKKAFINLSVFPGEERGTFECSDGLLNQIWKISRNTLEVNMLDDFVSTCYREHMACIPDGFIAFLGNAYLYGDMQVIKRTLRFPIELQEPEGWIPTFFPSDSINCCRFILEGMLSWISDVEYYYSFTRDKAFIEELYDGMKKLMIAATTDIQPNNLLKNKSGGTITDPWWTFVDWCDYDQGEQNAFLNMLFVLAARRMKYFAEILGKNEDMPFFSKCEKTVTSGIRKHLWHNKEQVFVDSILDIKTNKMSSKTSLQQNAMAILLEFPWIDNEILYRKVLGRPPRINHDPKKLRGGMDCSPLTWYWISEALMQAGHGTHVINDMKIRWGNMVKAGATSCWETFDPTMLAKNLNPEGEVGGSICQALSCYPMYVLGAYVLGVRRDQIPAKNPVVAPVTADLKWARGTVPLSNNRILKVEWEKKNGKVIIDKKIAG